MGKIRILDESVSNIIAAGEVVENPASMIKELLENSLDADSKNIIIEVKNGGRDVKISDDGIGMSKEDLLLSTERHATSKISEKEDIFNLSTYGFRGEALSSISSVSKLFLSSKTEEDKVGNSITVSAGKITSIKEFQRNRGTTIEIKELFFNTPARLKFLRKPNTEYSNIKDIVLNEALSNNNVAITLIIDGKTSIKTSGNGIDNTIVELFGKNVLKNIKKFSLGYLGNSTLYKSTKDGIFIFINGRTIKSKIVENAILDGYYTKLMKGKYPFAIIFLEIDPKEIDINVHPSKKIVKFSNDTNIYNLVLNAINNSFAGDSDFISAKLPDTNDEYLDFSFFNSYDNNSKDDNSKDNEDTQQKKENENNISTNLEKFNIIEEFENLTKEKNNLVDNFSNTKTFEEKKSNFDTLKAETQKFIFSEDKEDYSKNLENNRLSKNKKIKDEKSIQNENFNFQKNEILPEKEFLVKEEKKSNFYDNNTVIDIDKENTKVISNNYFDKNKFKVFGQIYESFILVERGGEFEIFDQHIVHERILYEKLKKQLYSDNNTRQQLLVPIRVSVTPKEYYLVLEYQEELKNIGFELDIFSENEILIRSIPAIDLRDSSENIFRDILANLKENKNFDIKENIIISMSCKGAIKANHKLSISEMETLLNEFLPLEEYTCPHGRPIIVKITLNDLEKFFKRK